MKICSAPESSVSLITVEYDVRDYDDPESTEFFRLEPASDDVIDHILEHQAPQLSLLDRHRIMGFSNGNARVALALAHTVKRGDSVANLSDTGLIQSFVSSATARGRRSSEGSRGLHYCLLI